MFNLANFLEASACRTPEKTAETETKTETKKADSPTEIEVEVDEPTDPLELAMSTELAQITGDYPLLQGGR